jgi:hypothetical protein
VLGPVALLLTSFASVVSRTAQEDEDGLDASPLLDASSLPRRSTLPNSEMIGGYMAAFTFRVPLRLPNGMSVTILHSTPSRRGRWALDGSNGYMINGYMMAYECMVYECSAWCMRAVHGVRVQHGVRVLLTALGNYYTGKLLHWETTTLGNYCTGKLLHCTHQSQSTMSMAGAQKGFRMPLATARLRLRWKRMALCAVLATDYSSG